MGSKPDTGTDSFNAACLRAGGGGAFGAVVRNTGQRSGRREGAPPEQAGTPATVAAQRDD